MRITVRYKYKEYPFSEELTKRSKYVGYYTSWFISLPLSVFTVLAIGDSLFSSPSEGIIWLSLAGIMVFWILVLVLIRKLIYKRMDRKHQQIIEDLQNNDSIELIRIPQEPQSASKM